MGVPAVTEDGTTPLLTGVNADADADPDPDADPDAPMDPGTAGLGTDTDLGTVVGAGAGKPAPEIPNAFPTCALDPNKALAFVGGGPPLFLPTGTFLLALAFGAVPVPVLVPVPPIPSCTGGGAAILTKSFFNASTFPPTSPAASIAADVV